MELLLRARVRFLGPAEGGPPWDYRSGIAMSFHFGGKYITCRIDSDRGAARLVRESDLDVLLYLPTAGLEQVEVREGDAFELTAGKLVQARGVVAEVIGVEP